MIVKISLPNFSKLFRVDWADAFDQAAAGGIFQSLPAMWEGCT
jgi:hypothetical protein